MSISDRTVLAHPISANLSRRSLLRGAIGAAVMAAGTAGLAACGGGSGDSGSGDAAEAAVIRLGVANPGANADTQLTSNSIGLSENVCDTLVTLDPETKEVKPLLLTALPTASDDGLLYTFEHTAAAHVHSNCDFVHL